jgi:hypothetical protein
MDLVVDSVERRRKNPVKVLFRFRISSLRNFPSNCPLISGQPHQWVKNS